MSEAKLIKSKERVNKFGEVVDKIISLYGNCKASPMKGKKQSDTSKKKVRESALEKVRSKDIYLKLKAAIETLDLSNYSWRRICFETIGAEYGYKSELKKNI